MNMTIPQPIAYARRHKPGYEVSSKGDKRFSALFALMPDGRTIEMWYQCDIKGYQPGGSDWRLGKGKPPLYHFTGDEIYQLYLSIWRLWAIRHQSFMVDLLHQARNNGNMLTDCFASSDVNQARALADILNEWFV